MVSTPGVVILWGKIRLRCQIGDLKSEVTCYVIDADMSYNLLLGRSWIHANWIVPSMLHQCFKYVGDDVVRTVFAEIQPFKEVKHYFTDSLLYQEDNEPVKRSLLDDIDSGNEADSKILTSARPRHLAKLTVHGGSRFDLIQLILPDHLANGMVTTTRRGGR